MQFNETLEKIDVGYLKNIYIFTTVYTHLSFCFNVEEVKLFLAIGSDMQANPTAGICLKT